MNYEDLLNEAETFGVNVDEKIKFNSAMKGLCVDNNIALSDSLNTSAEKACILSEELAHFNLTVGNIVDQKSTSNRKQEHKARTIAYMKMIGLSGIISAYKAGCRNQFEIAEFLNVTEDFLDASLSYFSSKYGICTKYNNYLIYFEPLGVLELYN